MTAIIRKRVLPRNAACRILCLLLAVIITGTFSSVSAATGAVSLNMDSIDLPTGYYSTLKVTGAKGEVSWKSNNSDVVSVQDMGGGKADIIAVNPGTAYVFASADGAVLRCRVTVADSFIYSGSSSITIYPGDSRVVRIAVTGSKNITMGYNGKRTFSPAWGKWSGSCIDINIKGVSPGNGKLYLYTEGSENAACAVDITVADNKESSSPWSVKPVITGEEVIAPVSPFKGKIFPVALRVTDTYESLCDEMDGIISGYPYESAVLLYSPSKGYLYRHNADKYMSGGCTIKVPYVYYCCLQIEQGKHSVDELVAYEPKHRVGGSGVIQNYKYGTKWSIGTLLDYSMRYSDNVAYYMLISVFGREGFNRMIKDWGYSTGLYSTNYPNVNSEMLCTSMLRLHEKVISSDESCWEYVWTGLTESIFYEVRKEINYCDVAVKCGLPKSYYNEVCYIDSESPYVLVIMSRTNNSGKYMDGDENFFRSVARCADKINQLPA